MQGLPLRIDLEPLAKGLSFLKAKIGQLERQLQLQELRFSLVGSPMLQSDRLEQLGHLKVIVGHLHFVFADYVAKPNNLERSRLLDPVALENFIATGHILHFLHVWRRTG